MRAPCFRLHLRQQLLNPIFLLNRCQPAFNVLLAKLRLGLTNRLIPLHFNASCGQTLQSSTDRQSPRERHALADRPSAPLLGNQ